MQTSPSHQYIYICQYRLYIYIGDIDFVFTGCCLVVMVMNQGVEYGCHDDEDSKPIWINVGSKD